MLPARKVVCGSRRWERAKFAFMHLVVSARSRRKAALRRKEFDLLALLARNIGRIVTHRQLLADI